mmetsp:Transcript_124565/g.311488  ORF Transcript_124565/g.311488 Transcript_124565/m.311488 type:complete len:106 (-) Transcript_124565:241-558(-)
MECASKPRPHRAVCFLVRMLSAFAAKACACKVHCTVFIGGQHTLKSMPISWLNCLQKCQNITAGCLFDGGPWCCSFWRSSRRLLGLVQSFSRFFLDDLAKVVASC